MEIRNVKIDDLQDIYKLCVNNDFFDEEVSYDYFSTNYNIPQGLGYAISGIYLFERNHERGFHEYSRLFDLIEKKPNNKNLSKKEKSKFVVKSLIKILKKNKLTLKRANISKSENKKILKFISKSFGKSNSNNPITLNKKDIITFVRRILER